MPKCEICAVYKRALASDEPACCAWYLEHVVCGGEESDCPDYEEDPGNG